MNHHTSAAIAGALAAEIARQVERKRRWKR
jgi:hypothetical protein